MYFVKTPKWLRLLYKGGTWSIPGTEKILYLTFDDGPHPFITPFVLDELQKVGAKATFFCIGKNVVDYPVVYERILFEGHAVGNHTHNHLNGWKTPDNEYLGNIETAMKYIDSKLFRPPYGKITQLQMNQLAAPRFGLTTVFWSILSGDFDQELRPEKCLAKLVLKAGAGDIVVFHDSEKAFERLEFTLPKFLSFFKEKGFQFSILPGS